VASPDAAKVNMSKVADTEPRAFQKPVWSAAIAPTTLIGSQAPVKPA